MATQIAARFPAEPVTLIAFSLGAPAALAVAARLGPEAVSHLHLISPAGPLQLGNFLPQMAGGPLFRLAADKPRLFRALVRLEGLAARLVPGYLWGRLMTGAPAEDGVLCADPAFRRAMIAELRTGLGRNWRGFAYEVRHYVSDWQDDLNQVPAPVTIWQGSADTWTPPAMAVALHAALSAAPSAGTRLNMLGGSSHYSTLVRALEQIEP